MDHHIFLPEKKGEKFGSLPPSYHVHFISASKTHEVNLDSVWSCVYSIMLSLMLHDTVAGKPCCLFLQKESMAEMLFLSSLSHHPSSLVRCSLFDLSSSRGTAFYPTRRGSVAYTLQILHKPAGEARNRQWRMIGWNRR